MREACFCGRVGEVEDRKPVLDAGRRAALRCPEEACGHLEYLSWLPEDARTLLLEEAARRHRRRSSRRPAASPPAYRKVKTTKGEEYVGGWILLESGEERGAIKNCSTSFVGDDIGF